MKNFIAKKTRWTRHKIVKRITPHIYNAQFLLRKMIIGTPRPMITIVKRYYKHTNLIGTEIGVDQGNNSLSILQMLPMEKLYLIDPYRIYVEDETEKEYSSLHSYDIAKQKLSSFPQVKFITKTSDEAYKDIHELLDFLYIDGNHTYEYVKRDINNYYPLIKTGGIIGGHDYTYMFNGVVKASQEFARENNLELNTIFPDWWIVKP